MIKFLQIPEKERKVIYQDVSNKLGVPPQAVEKDVWVTLILRVIFSSVHADRFIFKGGTSLSKAYNLIQRFSEDVDLGIDRTHLGFNGELSKGEIRRLRRACHSYVADELPGVLSKCLTEYGIDPKWYDLVVENKTISDQDPEILQVNFNSLFDTVPYLANNIKIEVSARSLIEPHQRVQIDSWIDQQYSDSAFVEGAFEVTATDPKKTLLEKLILLHEEFQKDPEKIRYIRMSRHYYDIDQLFNSEFGASALEDKELFESIIAHRSALTPMPNTNYEGLSVESLCIEPPKEFFEDFVLDYKEMQNSMIHGRTKDFKVLLKDITKVLKAY